MSALGMSGPGGGKDTGATGESTPLHPVNPRPRRTHQDVLELLLGSVVNNGYSNLDYDLTQLRATRGHPLGTLCLHFPDGDTWFVDIERAEET